MKVKIEVTVDVDPEAWHLNYGTETLAQVREDAKAHGAGIVTEQFQSLGLLTETEQP